MFKFFIIYLLGIGFSHAAIDTYAFNDKNKERRFHQLTAEMRCPKCQNQNLADSNAAIAQDLKQKIYQMLVTGKTDVEIVAYMVARYGDFVLYEPRFNFQNAILWLGPLGLLLLGLFIVVWIVRGRKQQGIATEQNDLNSMQQAELKQMLKKNGKVQ